MGEQSRGYGPLIGAVDQGTSSTRFLVFVAETGQLVTYHQLPVQTRYPADGWVEQDPLEILQSVIVCIDETCSKLEKLHVNPTDIKAIGIANQRETTVVWDRLTGLPLYPGIVWSDTRTTDTLDQLISRMPPSRANRFCLQEKCGLPLSPYFSALKLHWLLHNVDNVKRAQDAGQLLFGTMDSWLIWNLTEQSAHVTDVTNASRTMLMDIRSLDWDPFLLQFFDVPRTILPEIRSCAELFGRLRLSRLGDVPITGCLGDQQAALLGQHCLRTAQTKATYGTGCFLLANIGTMPVISSRGLLTTVAFRLGPSEPAFYALEGSIGQAGAALGWLRAVGILQRAEEATSWPPAEGEGVHVVPAFSGLLAPRWRPDARASISGITLNTEARHIVRATLEAIAFQVKELVACIEADLGVSIGELLVDGGLCHDDQLLQLQADMLGTSVHRPSMLETTALGAALAARLGWERLAEGQPVPAPDAVLRWQGDSLETFRPRIAQEERDRRYRAWQSTVDRSLQPTNEVETRDDESPSAVVSSVPGAFFLFSSFLLWLLASQQTPSDSL